MHSLLFGNNNKKGIVRDDLRHPGNSLGRVIVLLADNVRVQQRAASYRQARK